MNNEAIQKYARERGISVRDAAQTLMQVVVLKHLSLEGARLIGGTALVLGHGNPRFSEDVDLTGLKNPFLLEAGLKRSAVELEGWLGASVTLSPPKHDGRTWKLTARLNSAESLQLHIDSQEFLPFTLHTMIVRYPSIPAFVCATVTVAEIMADKVIAIVFRRYLGGRDLFDLWFHWLGTPQCASMVQEIRQYVKLKLDQRSKDSQQFFQELGHRCSSRLSLERAKAEWQRYLTTPFQKQTVLAEIVTTFQRLPELFHDFH